MTTTPIPAVTNTTMATTALSPTASSLGLWPTTCRQVSRGALWDWGFIPAAAVGEVGLGRGEVGLGRSIGGGRSRERAPVGAPLTPFK